MGGELKSEAWPPGAGAPLQAGSSSSGEVALKLRVVASS